MSDEHLHLEDNTDADSGAPSSESTNAMHVKREMSPFMTDFLRIAAPLALPVNTPKSWYKAVRARPVLSTAYYTASAALGAGLAYKFAATTGDPVNTMNIAISGLDSLLDGIVKTSYMASAAYAIGHATNYLTNRNFNDLRTIATGTALAIAITGVQAVDGNDKGVDNMSLLYTDPVHFIPSVLSEITDRIAPSSQGTIFDAYLGAGEAAKCIEMRAKKEGVPTWLPCRDGGQDITVIIDDMTYTNIKAPLEPIIDVAPEEEPTMTPVEPKSIEMLGPENSL